MSVLAFVETPFLSITAMVADAMLKAADVELLGFESTGAESLMIRLRSESPGAASAAMEAGRREAERLGAQVISCLLCRPDPSISSLNESPSPINPLYGGRDELLPMAHSNTNMKNQALGILETQGLTAILEATDAMLKAGSVELVGKEKIGAAYVTVMIRGDVAAVQASIDAGVLAAKPLGKVIAAHVIARPHEGLQALLPG